MEHRTQSDLKRADFVVAASTTPTGYVKVTPGDGDSAKTTGHSRAHCYGVPLDAAVGFSKGCLCQRLDGTVDAMLYLNVGDETSASWTAVKVTAG